MNLSSLSTTEGRQVPDTVVAMLLGLKVSTLRKWRLTPGFGPKWRYVGRTVRYGLGDLQTWISTRPGGGEGQTYMSVE